MRESDATMQDTTPGFDRRNAWLYRTATATMFVASLVVALKVAFGTPPDYVEDRFVAGIAYAASSVVAIGAYLLLKAGMARGTYALAASMGGFVLAGYLSGFPQKGLWILGISSLAIVLVSVLLGDKADRNTADKTIRIKLPW